jgi:hypothetical protein
VEQDPWSETVEVDEQRWISLEFSRRWPKYVVSWQLRQRSGEGDFPADRGEIDQMPAAGEDGADAIWDSLREQAIQTANESAASTPVEAPARPSLLRRLFGSR